MRLEAWYQHNKLVLYVVGAEGYENASATRKEVGSSRYSRTLSDRDNDVFAFVYPLSVDKCNEMREVWGSALKVERDLSEWYRAASKGRKAQASITTQTDAELSVVASRYPAFNAWLKGDQRVTAAWMAGLYRNGGVLADEVGTGKTAGVVAGLIERGTTGNVLIVCPKISVRSVWGKHFKELVPDVPVFLCRGTRKARTAAIMAFNACTSPLKVLIVVAEMLRVEARKEKGRIVETYGYSYPELFESTWDGIIIDESHKVLGSLDVVKGNNTGEGVRSLSLSPQAFRLAVSATPFGKGGRVEAMFGTLHWLWKDEFPSRWAWLGRFFTVVEERVPVRGGRGAMQTVRRVAEPTSEQEAYFWDSLGPRVLRRTMEEVSPEHKGLKNWIEVSCDMDPKQRKQYEHFALNAELAVDGGIISTVGVLDFMTRSRQLANGVLRMEGGRVVYNGESGKLDKLMFMLEKWHGRKVVITSQYNEFLDVVEKRLLEGGYWSEYVGHVGTHPNGSYVRLDGKTSEAKRDAYMHLFQEDPNGPNVFLLNSQAGGVSITLDAADAMFCLDEMYPPEANTQLYGRIFRRGRVHEVFFFLFRTAGTIDEKIGHNVGEGHARQLRLLDGRRGLEYVRTLAKYEEE